MLTGVHGAHVLAGLGALLLLFVRLVRARDLAAGRAVRGRRVVVLAHGRCRMGGRVPHRLGRAMSVASGRLALDGGCAGGRRRDVPGVDAGRRPGGRRRHRTSGRRSSALPRALRDMPRRGRCRRHRPRALAPARRSGVDRLRAAHRPHATRRLLHPTQPWTGAVRRRRDPRPRGLRRRDRRRSRYPRRRSDQRLARRRCPVVPAQLRGVPRGVRRWRRDRHGRDRAVVDGVDADPGR